MRVLLFLCLLFLPATQAGQLINPYRFASTWTPSSPSNTLKIWAKADALSGSDGSDVDTWTVSAGANNLSRGSESAPVLRTGSNGKNGKNVVSFDGVGDLLFAAFGSNASQPYTVSITFQRLGGHATFFDGNSGAGDRLVLRANTTWEAYAGGSYQGNTTGAPNADNGWHTMTWTINGGSSGYILDNVVYALDNSPGTDALSGVTLGGHYTGVGAYSQVKVAEVIVWAGSLSSGDKASLYSYIYNGWHDGSDSWPAP